MSSSSICRSFVAKRPEPSSAVLSRRDPSLQARAGAKEEEEEEEEEKEVVEALPVAEVAKTIFSPFYI